MEGLVKADREVLILLSEGVADVEICRRLRLSRRQFGAALERIQARAEVESDDAGRFYERSLRQRAERMNIAQAARLKALMDALPQAVLVIDGRTGAIKEVNRVACDTFGYDPAQLLDLTIEDLVPEEFRAHHIAYRVGFLASVRKREMGYHPPIFGLHRDGHQFELAVSLTATMADDDVMVVCCKRTPCEPASAVASVDLEHPDLLEFRTAK